MTASDDRPTHVCDTGNFDRTVCPDPCGAMHSFCATCGIRQDPCCHDKPAPDEARMTLTADEQADLRNAFDTGWLTLYTHVTELVSTYHAQGLVIGDLMHDGTIQAQLEAGE